MTHRTTLCSAQRVTLEVRHAVHCMVQYARALRGVAEEEEEERQ